MFEGGVGARDGGRGVLVDECPSGACGATPASADLRGRALRARGGSAGLRKSTPSRSFSQGFCHFCRKAPIFRASATYPHPDVRTTSAPKREGLAKKGEDGTGNSENRSPKILLLNVSARRHK